MNQEIFAHNVRILRMASKITAQDLSLELNLSLNRISAIEGNPKVHINEDEIAAISAHFNHTIEDLTTKKAKICFE